MLLSEPELQSERSVPSVISGRHINTRLTIQPAGLTMSAGSAMVRKAPHSVPIKLHPWSLAYIRLRLSAMVIRGLLGSGMALEQFLLQSVPKDVQVTKTTIASREQGRSIRVHIYQPKDLDTSKPAAVHLNFHGSGFMIPCLASDREFCGKLASRLNMIVVDCDYRKAPEKPWPAAIQDTEDCLLWALSQPKRFDLSRVTIGGFSAGANLALCTSTLYGKELKGVVTFYPPCDFTVGREFKKAPPEKHSHAIPLAVAKMFDQSYILQTGVDRGDPRISPAKADPTTFPPLVWLCCGRGDSLYNDGKKLMDSLASAGHSQTTFHEVPGEAHAFDKANRAGTEKAKKTQESYRLAFEAVEKAWSLDFSDSPTAKL
ncbi:unnamed protein product [Parajaminaea phylloscopi]